MIDGLDRIATLKMGVLGLSCICAACSFENPAAQRSPLPNVSPAPISTLDPRATSYALNETEMANLAATNIVRLTQTAPYLPTCLPDPANVHEEEPQRLAGNGVIIETQFMGRGLLWHTNEWVGYVDRTIVEVVAGAEYTIVGAASEVGELLVASFDGVTGERLDVQEYFAHGDTGALSILDVEGSHLILTTTRQQVLVFDLSQRSFVSVDEPYTRSVSMGEGTLELESTNSSTAEKRELIWTVRLTDDPGETVVTLTTGEGDGDWSLSFGGGSPVSPSTTDAVSVPTASGASTMRVFDVRGQTILFVAERKLVWVFNVVTGQWSSAMVLSGQPDYLATKVPVYDALLETGYGPVRDRTQIPVEQGPTTSYP